MVPSRAAQPAGVTFARDAVAPEGTSRVRRHRSDLTDPRSTTSSVREMPGETRWSLAVHGANVRVVARRDAGCLGDDEGDLLGC